MTDNLEYNYLQNQLQSNNIIKSIMHNEISQLFQIIQQKRNLLDELERIDLEITARLNAIPGNNKIRVDYNPLKYEN